MLLETVAAVIINCTYLFLKVSSNGEFPSPLSSAKEREHFLRYKDGDIESRNILIERNLRLVAHIVKA
ncbi:MAG: sporulation sigma factor SigK [Oscillospiraceae bacterium]|nr:sporulation sigma factor SigK [Oscillospiraceae bacterium]